MFQKKAPDRSGAFAFLGSPYVDDFARSALAASSAID